MASDDYFETVARQIKEETSIKKEPEQDKNKSWAFISRHFTFSMPPQGSTKSGKVIRYVKGLKSLDIAEQRSQADTFNLTAILFEGAEGTRYEIEGYTGRSLKVVSDPALAKFLQEHERYGDDFILYDKEKQIAKKVESERKVNMAKVSVLDPKVDQRDLVRVLSYLDLKERGSDTYDALKNSSKDSLISKCLLIIDKDIDKFIDAMGSKESKAIFLVNLAVDKGIITVSSDGREVKRADNNKVIIRSSIGSNWQTDLKNYLVSETGQSLGRELVLRTGYAI